MHNNKKLIFATVYKLLGKKEYTRFQLNKKLRQKFVEVSCDEINEALDELENKNIISDLRFFESFVRSKINSGWGENKIKLKLKEKGISAEILKNNEAHFFDLDLSKITEEIKRKYNLEDDFLNNLEWSEKQKFKAKIYRRLLSRGFKFDQIKKIQQDLES